MVPICCTVLQEFVQYRAPVTGENIFCILFWFFPGSGIYFDVFIFPSSEKCGWISRFEIWNNLPMFQYHIVVIWSSRLKIVLLINKTDRCTNPNIVNVASSRCSIFACTLVSKWAVCHNWSTNVGRIHESKHYSSYLSFGRVKSVDLLVVSSRM